MSEEILSTSTTCTTTLPPMVLPTAAFVWNGEYEVYVAVGRSLKHARWLLEQEFISQTQKYVAEVEEEGVRRARLDARMRDFAKMLRIIERDPAFILTEGMAEVYDHANE